jgi:hypothetical protein
MLVRAKKTVDLEVGLLHMVDATNPSQERDHPARGVANW